MKIYRGATRALVTPFPSDFYFGVDGLGDNNIENYREIRAQREHAAFALIELSKKYKGTSFLSFHPFRANGVQLSDRKSKWLMVKR